MDKHELIKKVTQDEDTRLFLSRVWDKWEQCTRKNIPTATAFLSPAEQASAQYLFSAMPLTEGYVFWGGYEEAERKQLFFLPEWMDTVEETAIRVIRASYYETGKLNHRDFLGSLMGLGITREKIGDILVTEESADILVSESLAEYLLENWTSAGRSALKVREVSLKEIHIPQEKVKMIRDTVPSLRLDNLVASGFSTSRAKAAEAIAQGKVQINWTECRKSDKIICESDIISFRGLGKCKVETIGQETKKGRLFVTLKRYL